MKKLVVALLGLSSLGQVEYLPVETTSVPTIASYSQTSGCIYVQRGEGIKICGVDFMVIMP